MAIEKKEKINCENARNISIIEILQKLGYFPNRKREKEAWFLSPFRVETIASFKVDLKINRWYDHGEGIGGNVIDFVMLILKCTVKEALEFLNDDINIFSFHQHPKIYPKLKPERSYEIIKVKPLSNEALIQYLKFRKIKIEIAKQYCKEIYYKLEDKNYFTIAFENNSKGYEIRNKYFKGSIGNKDITFLKNGANRVSIFEGFFDYLSYKTLYDTHHRNEDYIICNSTALVQKLVPELKKYRAIHLFFDNDNAGNEASKFLMEKLKGVIDCRQKYSDFKDFNDYLVHYKNIQSD
jgi:5S rRNA maturation endonuclease (ribonuclease M5)